MTAQLRKEARALLPYWAGTLAVIVAPYLLLGRRGAELSWFTYSFGCALQGGVSFGQEFQHRTLPMLLSQPISRSAIWRDKMIVLAAAVLTSTALLMSMSTAFGTPSFFDDRFLPFVPLCVLCGAPLLTLLTGSALGGTIFSLSVPGFSLMLSAIAHSIFPAVGQKALIAIFLSVYCVLMGILGPARFRTYEVRDRISPSLGIPGWLLPKSSSAPGTPLGALLRKELRLQQLTIVFFTVFVWSFFFLCAVTFDAIDAGGGDWRKIAQVVTVMDLLLVPLVAGAVAIGEERSLGVADWQLSLPPSARLQWLAKMLVTLASSLVIGLVLPLLVVRPALTAHTLAMLVLGHLMLTHLALYAASLTKGTMPALLLSLGLWSATFVAVVYGGVLEKFATTRNLPFALAAMVVLLNAFALSNYRQRGLRLGRIGLQGLAASGALAISWAFL